MASPPKPKHDHQPLIFPKGFLWGSATAAHQVEGNNTTSDWWEWEKKHQPPHLRSGLADDQYHLYKEDFELAKSLNQNAHRLSIEWARIEPEEGVFNQDAIDHYVDVLKTLKDLDIKVMLTLWHFTLPLWVAKKGGWENSKTPELFANYVKRVLPQIKKYVDFWVTINEPSVYTLMSYIYGEWPPQKKDNWAAFKVLWHLAEGHKKVYKLLHTEIVKPHVGIAHNIQSFEPFHRHSVTETAAVFGSDIASNHSFYFLTKGHHDYLGINYYFHYRFDKKGHILLPGMINARKEARDVSDLGWEIYPEGIFEAIADVAGDLPIYITECGIASTNDERRIRFLLQYLQETYRAIKSGVPVKGFFYWSLLDNFEWHRGFDPRFGLIEIDYKTQKRTPRASAYLYSEIIKDNGISHDLMKFLGHRVHADEVLCSLHNPPKAFCEHLSIPA
jgi:beta-glucosidase